jgi:hypothetical protein
MGQQIGEFVEAGYDGNDAKGEPERVLKLLNCCHTSDFVTGLE